MNKQDLGDAYGGAANGIPRNSTRSPVAFPWNDPQLNSTTGPLLEADRETPTQLDENRSVKERTFARGDIRYQAIPCSLSQKKKPKVLYDFIYVTDLGQTILYWPGWSRRAGLANRWFFLSDPNTNGILHNLNIATATMIASIAHPGFAASES